MGDLEKALRYGLMLADQLDQRAVWALFGVVVIALLLIFIVSRRRRRNGGGNDAFRELDAYEQSLPPPMAEPLPPPVPPPRIETLDERLIAEIVETNATGSPGGWIAMMIITWIVAVVVFVVSTTVFGQIIGLLIWIGGNTMFGVGVLSARERSYRVYRPVRKDG